MLKESFKQRCVKRIAEIVFMIISVSIIMVIADSRRPDVNVPDENIKDKTNINRQELTVWYHNKDYEKYLECLAEEYEEDKGITLNIKYISDIGYFDSINKANKHTDDTYGNPPDVYLLSSEELEEAYGYGLAAENDNPMYNTDNYSETALRAVSYRGKKVAYPLLFNTTFMIYNTDYLQSVPEYIDDIMSYESSFQWEKYPDISHVLYFDISDVLHTYAFAGAYINMGGETGDDKNTFEVDTGQLTKELNYYHDLSGRLRMNHNSNFAEIPEMFMEGKVICSIMDLQEFNKIRRMGNVKEIKYSICELPPVNKELETKTLSYTEVMVVNYMSEKEEMAKELAEYATYERTDLIYANTGFLPTRHIDYVDPFNEMIQRQYDHSAILPKFRVTKDYYLQMQSMLNGAWKGSSINDIIQKFIDTYEMRLHAKSPGN